jgi:hypothetical protein
MPRRLSAWLLCRRLGVVGAVFILSGCAVVMATKLAFSDR